MTNILIGMMARSFYAVGIIGLTAEAVREALGMLPKNAPAIIFSMCLMLGACLLEIRREIAK